MALSSPAQRRAGSDAGGSPSTLPLWVRAADVASVVLLVLTLSVLLSGGVRTRLLGEVRFSASSPWRVGLMTAGFLALRHALVRRQPLHRRVARGLRGLPRSEAVRAAWPVFVGTRLPVLAVGYLAVVTIGYAENSPPFRVSSNELWNLPARWDAGWYLGIARDGYRWDRRETGQQNVAFFPAFPALMQIAGALVGARPHSTDPRDSTFLARRTYPQKLLAAGVSVSLAAFLWALVYLFKLAREDIGERAAATALALLAAYPFALFFSAAYTESLYLLGTAAAIFHFRKRQLGAASAWGLLVGLTRPNGCLLSIPLAAMALDTAVTPRVPASTAARVSPGDVEVATPRPRRWLPRVDAIDWRWLTRSMAAASMPGIGMLLFSAYCSILTRRPFVWAEAHRAWGREFRGLDALVGERYDAIAGGGFYEYTVGAPVDLLNGFAALFALVLVWPVLRRFGLAYALLLLVNIGPPLFAGGLLSMGRFTSVLFPLFFYVAAVMPVRQAGGWIVGSAVLQGLLTALFFTWRPLF